MALIITALTIVLLITMTIATGVVSYSISENNSQTANRSNTVIIQPTKNQQTNNATQSMILTFKTADSLLMKALKNLSMGKAQEALGQLNNAKVQIEKYQLAALDAMSNPVLQSSRAHLLAAEQALKMGNTDQAISELNLLRQLRILHQQGMMIMKLPMAGEMNSTFNSLESHLLAADEKINSYNTKGAIYELNIANDQLYEHQLAMLDSVYSFLNNTRTHLKQSITDTKSGNIQGAISEVKIVNQLLRDHEQGMAMILGMVRPQFNMR
jgi:environmental stress-induced protein Ves